MSYKELTFSLENRGLTLIRGVNQEHAAASSNGAGKTSLIDAITWVLFGSTIRGLSADGVVNKTVKKDCSVTLELDLHGKKLKIERFRSHGKMGNSLKLYVDDVCQDADDNKATQARIEELINMNFVLFTTSVLFGQGITQHFAELTDKGQKEVIETITDTRRFEVYLNETKEQVKIEKEKHVELLNQVENTLNLITNEQSIIMDLTESAKTHLQQRKNSLVDAKQQLKLVTAQEKECNDSLKKVSKELAEMVATIETMNDDAYLDLKTQYIELESKVKDNQTMILIGEADLSRLRPVVDELDKLDTPGNLRYRIDQINIEKPQAEKALEDLKNLVAELKQAESKLNINKGILQHDIKSLEKTLASFDGLDAECPTCKQVVSAEHLEEEKSKLTQAIKDKTAELEKDTNTVEKLAAQLELADKEIDKQTLKLQEIADERVKLLETIDKHIDGESARKDLDDCMTKLVGYREHNTQLRVSLDDASIQLAELEKDRELLLQNSTELKNLESQKQTLEVRLVELQGNKKNVLEKIEELQVESTPYDEQIKTENEKLSKYVQERKDKEKEIEEVNNNLSYYDFWETAFGRAGLRSLLLDSVQPILDAKANEFSELLTDGTVRIQFNTQKVLKNGETRDAFNVQAFNSTGADVYKGNSGGEKRRIDICILLALQYLAQTRSNNSLNVVFFDEIFESVDVTGQEKIIQLLHNIANNFESVFVITHLTELASEFENVVTITKEKGYSIVK